MDATVFTKNAHYTIGVWLIRAIDLIHTISSIFPEQTIAKLPSSQIAQILPGVGGGGGAMEYFHLHF